MQCPQCHDDSPTDLARCPWCGIKMGLPAPEWSVTAPAAIAQRSQMPAADGQTRGSRVLLTPVEVRE
jgi:hypothetical protein